MFYSFSLFAIVVFFLWMFYKHTQRIKRDQVMLQVAKLAIANQYTVYGGWVRDYYIAGRSATDLDIFTRRGNVKTFVDQLRVLYQVSEIKPKPGQGYGYSSRICHKKYLVKTKNNWTGAASFELDISNGFNGISCDDFDVNTLLLTSKGLTTASGHNFVDLSNKIKRKELTVLHPTTRTRRKRYILMSRIAKMQGRGWKITNGEPLTKNFVTKEVDTCAVCQEFHPPTICYQASCNHYFNVDCILPWLIKEGTCPLCRRVDTN